MISFSSGCVINLDDLDDFPDYFQIIINLLSSFQQNKSEDKSMEIFLDADLEDVQHIPEFKQLIALLLKKHEFMLQNSKPTIKHKFIVLLLKLIKSYFTSFTMEEEQASPILGFLSKQLRNYPELFCDFWLSISKFAPYVQNHKEIVELYLQVIDQESILTSETLSLAYVKSVDKVLRFRMFRQAFQNAIILNQSQSAADKANKYRSTPFLKFKLARYGKKEEAGKHFEELVKFASSIKCSTFMRNYIELKQQEDK